MQGNGIMARAVGLGFEPRVGRTPTTVFKTAAFNRSATPPYFKIIINLILKACQSRRAAGPHSLCLKAKELPAQSCNYRLSNLVSVVRKVHERKLFKN